jgi:Fe-S-cluster containining protein
VILLSAAVSARDDACERWSAGAAEQLATMCRRGCHHCCYDLVTAQPFEAELIALKAPQPILERFVELSGAIAALVDKYAGATVEACAAWLAKATPCPALNALGECQIYELRPAACRSMLALSDPAMCSPGAMSEVLQVDPSEPLLYVEGLQRQLDGAPQWLPLVTQVAEFSTRKRAR